MDGRLSNARGCWAARGDGMFNRGRLSRYLVGFIIVDERGANVRV